MRVHPRERLAACLRRGARWVLCVAVAGTLTGCADGEPGPPGPRFQVHAIQTQAGPALVRFDSATGRLSHAPLMGSQRWQPIGDALPAAGAALAPGRYSFDFAQAPSTPLTFFRLDTQTGQVWRLAFGRDRAWTALQDRASASAAEDAPVPRPDRDSAPVGDGSGERPASPQSGFQPSKKDVDAFVEAVGQGTLPIEMRTWAVDQLGNGPARDATGPLIEMVYDENLEIARAAVRALGRLDDARVRPALERLRNDERAEIRRLAGRALKEQR